MAKRADPRQADANMPPDSARTCSHHRFRRPPLLRPPAPAACDIQQPACQAGTRLCNLLQKTLTSTRGQLFHARMHQLSSKDNPIGLRNLTECGPITLCKLQYTQTCMRGGGKASHRVAGLHLAFLIRLQRMPIRLPKLLRRCRARDPCGSAAGKGGIHAVARLPCSHYISAGSRCNCQAHFHSTAVVTCMDESARIASLDALPAGARQLSGRQDG